VTRLLAVLLASAVAAGCGGAQPSSPATDPDTIKKLEEEQKQASQGEK
jgi:ABC-type glycerol-3-phosphate transport system substrate-binding protein